MDETTLAWRGRAEIPSLMSPTVERKPTMATRELVELIREDMWDSRDGYDRMQELQDVDEDALFDYEREELTEWESIAEESESYSGDGFQDGIGFIADHYFITYAQELADDIGAIDRDATWPASYIDWVAAAEALKQDYTSIDIKGRTFWYR